MMNFQDSIAWRYFISIETRMKLWQVVVRKWVEQGIIKGKVEGKAELMIELLEDHFGSLSKDVKDKITSANADTLGIWSKKNREASSLDEIFKSNK